MGYVKDIEIPSDENIYEELVEFADAIAEQDVIELPEQAWIRTSDRFPDVGHNILISTIDGIVGEGEYKGFDGYHHKWIQYRWNATLWDGEVIAYMPLPEPYKGEAEEWMRTRF